MHLLVHRITGNGSVRKVISHVFFIFCVCCCYQETCFVLILLHGCMPVSQSTALESRAWYIATLDKQVSVACHCIGQTCLYDIALH